MNKVQVVQAVSAAGFYCRLCDRNFRDNLAYLEHINSPERTLIFVCADWYRGYVY